MDSPIRYLKLVGGPLNCESVLIGLKNGGVYQVFVNNPFPQFLAKQTGIIYCVDMNVNRTKVAIIDDTLTLYVYNIQTKELLYQVKDNKPIVFVFVYSYFYLKGTQCTNSFMECIIS
jgi:intraflagellar transport protein 122